MRYKSTKINGKKILKHRAVMEAHLGRKLRTDEYVHHRNGDKLDNRLENLEVMDPVQHGRLHHLKHSLTSTCIVCGVEFTPHKTKRNRKQTCGSRACWGKAIWIGRRRGQ